MLKVQLILLVALLLSTFLAAKTFAADEVILYVQEGCNYCAKVEEFIDENSLGDDILIKDILLDEAASEEYTQFFDENEVPLEDRGVPLLVDENGEWYTGDTPIISFFRDRYGIEVEPREMETTDLILLVVGGAIALSVVGYGVYKAIGNKEEK